MNGLGTLLTWNIVGASFGLSIWLVLANGAPLHSWLKRLKDDVSPWQYRAIKYLPWFYKNRLNHWLALKTLPLLIAGGYALGGLLYIFAVGVTEVLG